MVKLPRWPQEWSDQAAPQETARPDINNGPGGLSDGWQAPGWSPAGSGLGLLLDPETMAQIDFGDKGDSPSIQAPASMADKLAQERSHFFPPEKLFEYE
jgi:hypothetical protein